MKYHEIWNDHELAMWKTKSMRYALAVMNCSGINNTREIAWNNLWHRHGEILLWGNCMVIHSDGLYTMREAFTVNIKCHSNCWVQCTLKLKLSMLSRYSSIKFRGVEIWISQHLESFCHIFTECVKKWSDIFWIEW